MQFSKQAFCNVLCVIYPKPAQVHGDGVSFLRQALTNI